MSTQKRTKDRPILYNELKKKRGIMLTDSSWHYVQESAAKMKISASEYVERLIRKEIELTH